METFNADELVKNHLWIYTYKYDLHLKGISTPHTIQQLQAKKSQIYTAEGLGSFCDIYTISFRHTLKENLNKLDSDSSGHRKMEKFRGGLCPTLDLKGTVWCWWGWSTFQYNENLFTEVTGLRVVCVNEKLKHQTVWAGNICICPDNKINSYQLDWH